MRIAVLIGRVLDPSGIAVNRRHGRVFVNREEYILQPADRCALEAALRIKDASGAEVIALPRGPMPDVDVLRQAIAHGADRAISLKDDCMAEADEAIMAQALSALLRDLGEIALVLAGATTLDTGQGQLGPRLAQALGWAQVVGAWEVQVNGGRARAVVRDGGEFVTIDVDLPVVATLQPGALRLRYPDGTRLINVYREPAAVEARPLSDSVNRAGIRPVVQLIGQDFPPERERGVHVVGTPEEMAQAVAQQLLPRMQA
jgi:electron transfer flavoprotein beta subunit